MKIILSPFLFVLIATSCYAQEMPLLKISNNHRYLVTQDNEAFFWLGGAAWEMIHRLTREEIDTYLKDRADKGFLVIRTVILAELYGLNTKMHTGTNL